MVRDPSLRGRDRAVSDVVGTILMLGVAVSFVGIVALKIGAATPDPQQPLRLEITPTLTAPNTITLLHLGGASLPQADVRVIVSSSDTILYSAPAGPPGSTWEIGEELAIVLADPLPTGPADVTIAHLVRGEILATSSVVRPGVGGGGGAGAFTLTVMLDGSSSPPTLTAPSQVLAEATVAHDEGRKLVRQVYADLSEVDGPVWQGLRDDGTRGDRAAGDGVWSGVIDIPVSAGAGAHAIHFTALDLTDETASADATLTVA